MKMNKNILKNSWVLSIIIILISAIVNFLASMFINMISVIAVLATLFSAMFAGQIYFMAFKKIMPKILKLKVALNYLCIQVILSILVIFYLRIFEIWVLALIIGVSLIASAIVYWAIGFGGKIQLKAVEKK